MPVCVAAAVEAGRVGCGLDTPATRANLTSSPTAACGRAAARIAAKTECLAPSSPNLAVARLACVAAIAAAVAVRIVGANWSCWFCMKRLISSISHLSVFGVMVGEFM